MPNVSDLNFHPLFYDAQLAMGQKCQLPHTKMGGTVHNDPLEDPPYAAILAVPEVYDIQRKSLSLQWSSVLNSLPRIRQNVQLPL